MDSIFSTFFACKCIIFNEWLEMLGSTKVCLLLPEAICNVEQFSLASQNLQRCRFCELVLHVWRGLWTVVMTYKKSSFFPQTQIFAVPPPLKHPMQSPSLYSPPSFWIVFGFFLGLFNTFVFAGEKRTIELFHDILIFHTHFTNVILVRQWRGWMVLRIRGNLLYLYIF